MRSRPRTWADGLALQHFWHLHFAAWLSYFVSPSEWGSTLDCSFLDVDYLQPADRNHGLEIYCLLPASPVASSAGAGYSTSVDFGGARDPSRSLKSRAAFARQASGRSIGEHTCAIWGTACGPRDCSIPPARQRLAAHAANWCARIVPSPIASSIFVALCGRRC